MSKKRQKKGQQAVKRTTAGADGQKMFSITVVSLLAIGLLTALQLFGANRASRAEIRIPEPQVGTGPTVAFDQAPGASATPDTFQPLVGIVSGHRGYDPGAVCPDGLTEVDINYLVAVEVVSLLQRRGLRADLLDEYDDRLTGYQADALVSIHSDSCNIPGATGFKVARVTDSAIPEAEDRLVACLNQEYQIYTGLAEHRASITDGMTNYHAFTEIASHTPGAIIETGFMLDDRHLLAHKPKIVARGVAAGILCFFETASADPRAQ